MPQNAPLVLTIGGTEVTYSPVGIDSNNVASFRNRSASQLALQPTFTVGLDEPRAGGRDTTKGALKLTKPRSEVSASGTEVIKNDLIKLEMVTGSKATTADRQVLLDTFIAAMLDAKNQAVLVNPEHFW